MLCLLEFIDWRYSHSCWYFRPSFLSGSPLPPSPPFPKSKYSIYRQFVAGGEGGRILLESIFWRSLYSVSDQIRTYKIASPPQRKTKEGRGPRTDNHLPQDPWQVNFFRWRHFALLYISLIFQRCHPSPSASCLSLSVFLCVASVNPILTGLGGRGLGRSQIVRQRASLLLYINHSLLLIKLLFI